MKQQFHIVPVIARLFPFQIPEPQNNGGVIFRPLSDPDLQVIHTPCLVLMMSFVTYIFPFSGTQLMPAYEFTALFVVQLDMSVILKKPYNGVPIFIGAGDFTFFVKSGYLIEDGKLTQPIKDINIIGNGPKALADITMVANNDKIDNGTWTCGKDGQSCLVTCGMPSALVSKLTVGGES